MAAQVRRVLADAGEPEYTPYMCASGLSNGEAVADGIRTRSRSRWPGLPIWPVTGRSPKQPPTSCGPQ